MKRIVPMTAMMAPDSGDALCSVDGGDEVLLSAWDSYCKRFSRANAACVAKNLPEGKHTLTLRVSPTRNPESTGTTLRIGAFWCCRGKRVFRRRASPGTDFLQL